MKKPTSSLKWRITESRGRDSFLTRDKRIITSYSWGNQNFPTKVYLYSDKIKKKTDPSMDSMNLLYYP